MRNASQRKRERMSKEFNRGEKANGTNKKEREGWGAERGTFGNKRREPECMHIPEDAKFLAFVFR